MEGKSGRQQRTAESLRLVPGELAAELDGAVPFDQKRRNASAPSAKQKSEPENELRGKNFRPAVVLLLGDLEGSLSGCSRKIARPCCGDTCPV